MAGRRGKGAEVAQEKPGISPAEHGDGAKERMDVAALVQNECVEPESARDYAPREPWLPPV